MYVPLAEKARPKWLDEISGQSHILAPGKLLRNLIESKKLINMIFYGPPGLGKTTVAKIAAEHSKMNFKIFNCTSVTSAEIKETIDNSRNIFSPNGTLLYLDEIQYLNKKQQQILLEAMENGLVKIIASTTENPYFSIYNAILSRCIVFEFKPLSCAEIEEVIKRVIRIYEQGASEKIECSNEIIKKLSKLTSGDARKAINFLEAGIISSKTQDGVKKISEEIFKELTAEKTTLNYDKSGDSHYDLLSAFQKSMRGSDADAAIYYLAMLLEFGDLISVCRRLMVCACEDVGLAYPQIIPIVKSCVDIANQVGLPEARIPLSDAVILVCLAPKSNSAYMAVNKAQNDIKSGKIFKVPRHLQNIHCDGQDGNAYSSYIYPHDYSKHWVKQNYMCKEAAGSCKYYIPGANKNEEAFNFYWRKIKNEEAEKKR